MTKKKFTAVLICLMVVGIFSPIYGVSAEDQPKEKNPNDVVNDEGLGEENVTRGVGAMLGGLRAQQGGDMLGNVFSILLGQMVSGVTEMEETVPGTYVFHATENRTVVKDQPLGEWDPNFRPGNRTERIWLVDYWDEYEKGLQELPGEAQSRGIPFVDINRTIYTDINITYTMGVSITVIIHDSDNSFINAISKVIKAVQKLNEKGNEAIQDFIAAFAYFFIHINDIITGDELLIVNPTHYESVVVTGNYSESHHFYHQNGTAPGKWDMPTDALKHLNETFVNHTDMTKNDHFLDFLINAPELVPDLDQNKTRTISWAGFSFDLMQLWMKSFHLELDFTELAAAMQGNAQASGDAEAFNIFKGLDVEYYTIEHHMVNPLLYEDVNHNTLIDVWYTNVTLDNGTALTYEDTSGETKAVKKILSNEVRAVIGLKSLPTTNTWTVVAPSIITNDGLPAVQWNITLNNPEIFWVPVHLSAQQWAWSLPTESAQLTDVSLGFTFTPGQNVQLNDTETGEALGMTGKDMTVKLDQTWGKWDNTPASLGTVDMAVVFFTTMTHFHLGVDAKTGDEIPEEKLVQGNETYSQERGEFTFGRDAYLKDDAGNKNPILGKVDIAGPKYQQYSDAATFKEYKAQTQTIPWALFEGKAEGGVTNVNTQDQAESYSVDAFMQFDAAAMLYSVNYYSFDSTGQRIVHDPTFSVYMTFPSQSFVAWIVVFAVVALVGIAAVLITRAKNNR